MMIVKIYCNNTKRYIISAVEHASKLGYIRMYKLKNNQSVNDFLFRLNHFIQQPIENISPKRPDVSTHFFELVNNNSKNAKFFSWVKSSRNSIEIDRFNKTFVNEWLYNGNFDLDCIRFNKKLTSWLIEYNFNRPHQSLDYLTPIEYIRIKSNNACLKKKVSPKYMIDTAVEYILNLSVDELETISVEKISADIGTSQTRLWRYFKKEKNMTLKEFLVRIKINQAAILLRDEPGLTVKEISEKVGFYCYDYFFRIFNKYFGITPKRYRESKRIEGKYQKKKEKIRV